MPIAHFGVNSVAGCAVACAAIARVNSCCLLLLILPPKEILYK